MMNGGQMPGDLIKTSSVQVEITVSEAWINTFLTSQVLQVPLTRKYNLSGFSIRLSSGKVVAQADITERRGTRVSVTCNPRWDSMQQYIHLEEIEIQVFTKNIIVKGAGWFARTIMGAKLDRKVEQAINQLYKQQITGLLEKGIRNQLPGRGEVNFNFSEIHIAAMEFNTDEIKVKVLVKGHGHLQLK